MKNLTQNGKFFYFSTCKEIIATKLLSVIIAFSFCFCLNAQTASRQIQGTVTDINGEPLPAGISIKGTTTGTVTDFNGIFFLNISDNDAVLIVKSIGFLTKEISVGAQSKIDIQLEEGLLLLDELIVVGYGTHMPNGLEYMDYMVIKIPIKKYSWQCRTKR